MTVKQTKLFVIACIAILCMIIMATIVHAQPPTGIFQHVIINDNQGLYCFQRVRLPKRWGVWMQWPMHTVDRTKEPRSFKPVRVQQKPVNKIIGSSLLEWLNSREVSGHYNFSEYNRYDWENFAGDRYGTHTKKRMTFTIKQ